MFIRSRQRRAIERDLARLADGTLEPGRRERVERKVADSYELQGRLGDQRRAVAATRALAAERAPLALRLRRRALADRSRTRSAAFALGLSGVLAALVLMLGSLGGSQGVLTVAEAATIAVRSPTTVVAEPRDDAATLPRVSAAGLPFPYWEDRFGWVATGVRSDEVGGRRLTTVFYRSHGREIAYTIVPGSSLPAVPHARTTARGGVVVHSSMEGGRRVVTWERRGHTCVLSGSGVPLAALVKLAAWRGHGAIPY
ncbi:MAG TPA: hypothetical protein VMB27_13135 [Solirubrobacteraceae bacterium]|nr:hypothetical protein [Solirubrobacteraceae bacterium]